MGELRSVGFFFFAKTDKLGDFVQAALYFLFLLSFSICCLLQLVNWSRRLSTEGLQLTLGIMFGIGLDAAFKCCCYPNNKYCKISLISCHCTK